MKRLLLATLSGVAVLAPPASATAPLAALVPALLGKLAASGAAKGVGGAAAAGGGVALDPEAIKKAKDELIEQGEKSRERMLKWNNTAFDLMKKWAPEPLPSRKSAADDAEAVLKSQGELPPSTRPRLDWTNVMKLDQPTRRLTETAPAPVPTAVPVPLAVPPSAKMHAPAKLAAPQLPVPKDEPKK